MYIAALELRAHNHSPKAVDAMLARARASLADLPRELAVRRSQRYATANVLLAMGRFDSAFARYVEIASDTTDIAARGRAGVAAAGMRDTVTAKRISDELAKVQPPYGKAAPWRWRAAIAAQLGDKAAAVRFLEQAIKRGFAVGIELHRLTEFQSLHGYQPFEEILRPKG
jgi:tetratricopeptide (TPR) repeat protein